LSRYKFVQNFTQLSAAVHKSFIVLTREKNLATMLKAENNTALASAGSNNIKKIS